MALTEPVSSVDVNLGVEHTKASTTQARHLPGEFYNSPAIYQLEKERIYLKEWLCVARAEEIEKPGDFMTVQVMDESVILARDTEGRINAFSNVCRHRGVAVAQGDGHTDFFTCPYHSWTYDLTGQLVKAPYMEKAGRFDPATCRLNPLLVDNWAGWVFINFDREARPFKDFIARLDAQYGFFRQEELRLAAKFRVEVDCNWKFFNENNIDHYHVYTTHTETFGADFTRPENWHPELAKDGGFCVFFTNTMLDGEKHFETLSWMEDKPATFASWANLPPSFTVLGQCDHMQVLIVWPLDVEKCVVVDYTLVHPREFDRPGFDEKVKMHADLFEQIIVEDAGVVVSQQNALNSVGFAPGYVGNQEGAVHNNAVRYLERLFPED